MPAVDTVLDSSENLKLVVTCEVIESEVDDSTGKD